jgi:5-methylcytosine-specific restriction protein A
MARRTQELLEVGYYLSRFGTHEPPARLNVRHWREAYLSFYDSLGGERTIESFHLSLRNSRDSFDSHFPRTNRVGWRKNNKPAELTGASKKIFDALGQLEEPDVWARIASNYSKLEPHEVASFDEIEAEEKSNLDYLKTKTEGGIKVFVSKRIERNAAMRANALEIHGTDCMACGFNFNYAYGEWGRGFAEVHHLKPLHESAGERVSTNPLTDLVVLCSNCHRMVHRKASMTLSLDELKAKIRKSDY